jgi:hypothetical protein
MRNVGFEFIFRNFSMKPISPRAFFSQREMDMTDKPGKGIFILLLTMALVISSTMIAGDQWNAGGKESRVSGQMDNLLAYLQFQPGYPPAGGFKPYYPPGVQLEPRGLPYIAATPVPMPTLVPAFPGGINPVIIPG